MGIVELLRSLGVQPTDEAYQLVDAFRREVARKARIDTLEYAEREHRAEEISREYRNGQPREWQRPFPMSREEERDGQDS